MAPYLGPLELTGGIWVVGDPTRGEGLSVVLTPEGLEHRRGGASGPLLTIEWPRIVELGVAAAFWNWQATRSTGFAGATSSSPAGRDACSLFGVLRHPHDPLSMRYTHHQRGYSGRHVFVVQELFRRLTEARAVDRLGDPGWVRAAVAGLSSDNWWTASRGKRLVRETMQGLGVTPGAGP